MSLQSTWFVLITVLWAGFFVLEGFDFGVGMLGPFLTDDEDGRRALRSAIGPFWDGNEVWLLVAAGATFAAFPPWYATMFSAYYLPLFVVLLGLILRAVAAEYREKATTDRGRRAWDLATAGGCLVAPFLIGVVFGGLLGGLPIDADGTFTGSFADLVQPYALFTGATFAALCLFQGLMFLRIRLGGDLRARADRWVTTTGLTVVVLLAVSMVWTQQVDGSGVIPGAGAWVALTLAAAAAWLAHHPAHDGWGFACSSGAVAATVVGLFATLFPDLMVSTTSAAATLTTADSSGPYTLRLMTIVTVAILPVVLVYTAWGYWVFRHRIDPTRPTPLHHADRAGAQDTPADRAGTEQADAAPDR